MAIPILVEAIGRMIRARRGLAEALVSEILRLEDHGRASSAPKEARSLAIIATSARFPRPWDRFTRKLQPLTPAQARRLFLALVRPLAPSPRIAHQVLARARGSPLCLRHAARRLLEDWGHKGRIPESAELPPETMPI